MKSTRSHAVTVACSLALFTLIPGAVSAQTFTFTGCNGVSSTISITGNLTEQPVISGQDTTTYAWGFTGNYSLTAGGTTVTSSGFGTAGVTYSNFPGGGPITDFNILTPSIESGPGGITMVQNWSVNLQGTGTILTPGVFPTSLPPLSVWNHPTQDFISLGGTGIATYYLGCSSSNPPPPPGGGNNPPPGETLGDPSSQPGCVECGQPINIGTGNMFEQADDYHTAGPNPLGFKRYYNSLASSTTFAGTAGKNWRSNYDRYLNLVSSSSVIAERPDGQQITFTLTGGVWTPNTDIDVTLSNSGSTWALTGRDDSIETYTAISATEGLLKTIQARNGYAQTLTYNSSNQLTTVADSFQRSLSFTYVNKQLESVSTPDGLVITYGYTSGNLTSATYSTLPPATISYVYENTGFPSALTGIIDENGNRYASWTYDSNGRALTSQNAGGANLTAVAYNDTDGSRTVTNPLGVQELYKFTTLQGVPKVIEADRLATSTTAAATMKFTYDSNGYTASRTDWAGNVTSYVNDVHGQPTTITEAVGTPQQRITMVTYHSMFHLPLKIAAPGLTASFTYDNNGELLTKTLTDTTTTTSPYSTNGQTRIWTYTWSNFLETSVQSPRTDLSSVTKYTYDSSGALTSITNALNQVTKITQHTSGGFPQTLVDPNGVTANLTYDGRQRLLSIAINTSAGALTTKYTYDPAGNLTSATLPDGSSFTISYDAAHRLTGVTDKLSEKVAYTLDALGDWTQVEILDPHGTTQLKRSGVFDAIGRALKAIGGANQTTTFAYDADGHTVAATDPLSHATHFSFDALNRMVKGVDAANGNVTLGFDAYNRATSITDPNGSETTYVYDGFGDRIAQTNAASGSITYRYDANGNLTQKTDARGVIANYSYDALDRVIRVTYPGDTAENVTYTYDESGHGFGVGRLTSSQDAAGNLSRSYDERGNILKETRTHGSVTLTTTYRYDAASHVIAITYPSQWSVTCTRDVMGRITAANAQAPKGGATTLIVSGATYKPFGPMNALTYGNHIAETRSFDLDYRLTGIASSVQKLTYGYDAADNVVSIADGVHSANNQTFTYDTLNRLESAAGLYGKFAYTYDPNGNRLTETSSAASDDLGSVSTLTYNQAGRLATVSTGQKQLTQYAYDGFARRVVKTGSVTSTTLYQYDRDGRLIEEADGQGNARVDYVYIDGRPVATIQPGNKIHYLHDDRIGTPQIATDSKQNIIWTAQYQPFGQVSEPVTIVENLRFPGQEFDLETGLYHNGFRNYIPMFGKYLESDPSGLHGGLNTYAYASANPLRNIDPLGLCNANTTQNGTSGPYGASAPPEKTQINSYVADDSSCNYDACEPTVQEPPSLVEQIFRYLSQLIAKPAEPEPEHPAAGIGIRG